MARLEDFVNQFRKAVTRLEEALSLPRTDIVRDSAIQRFEFSLDLGWKALKVYLEDVKGIVCTSPKDCFREAYRQKLIDYDEAWIKIVEMRNDTVHTYNEETAEKVYAQLPEALKHFQSLLNIF